MLDLFFDTETTGLCKLGHDPLHEDQPDIVQIGALLYKDRKVVAELNLTMPTICKEIGEHAFNAHGISKEMTEEFGISPKLAIAAFDGLLKKSTRAIAFNTAFDRQLLRTAYARLGATSTAIESANFFCAMLTATPVVKKPGRYAGQYGWPKLIEAYKALVDENGFEGAHDAMADVRATAAVWYAMEDAGHAPYRPK